MILIISKPKSKAEDLCDMFNFMGVLSIAKSPAEALSEISEIYRAIILIGDSVLYDEGDFIKKIRLYSSAPICSFGKPCCEENFDIILDKSSSASKILANIKDFAISYNLAKPGEYKTYGLDLSVDKTTSTFFSRPIHLTKTELMILRTLIRFYPNPIKPKQILYYAFRQKRAPEESSIRTHISVINKKFEKYFSKRIITNPDNNGYLILTNEIIEKIKASAI